MPAYFISMFEIPDHILPLLSSNADLLAYVVSLHERLASVTAANEQLRSEIAELRVQVSDLQAKLALNSQNSSKPPSTDLKKPKTSIPNNREKTPRKQGAQPGHSPHILTCVDKPDFIVKHLLEGQCTCGNDLSTQTLHKIRKTQVFDLPQSLSVKVTEHQSEVKICTCGKTHMATLVSQAPAIYGERIRALILYLNQFQYIPKDRLQQLCQDIFNCSISDGLIYSILNEANEQLAPVEAHIVSELLTSPVIGADETSLRVYVSPSELGTMKEEAAEGTQITIPKSHYVHIVSNPQWTLYGFANNRGKKAVTDMGILPHYQGTLIHDRYAMYWKYGTAHGLCNAHLTRELRFLSEECQLSWATQMRQLLLECHRSIKEGTSPPLGYSSQYDTILAEAAKRHPNKTQSQIEAKSVKESKAYLLMSAFKEHKDSILRFANDPDVPFDNNDCERGLRMIKLQQKIAGCFRSYFGAKTFCRIRSYLASAQKQGINVFNAITRLVQGNPYFTTS